MVPKSFVAVGGISVHLDFDVGKLPFADFGVDFDVAEVTLSDGDHGETAAVHVDHHARKLQVGVQLLRKPLVFHFLVKLLNVSGKETTFIVGRGFHALQSPTVAVDGHGAAQALEGATAHGVERNHIERVARADWFNRFQGEEIMCFAASADGVDVIYAGDVDGFLIKTDALHTVHQVDERRLIHAGHFGAKYVLQFAVGRFEQHLGGGFHHHQVTLFQDAVEHLKVGLVLDSVAGDGLSETAAVDGEHHLVVHLVAVRFQRIGVVGLAVRHEAVDDAVGGVFAGLDGHFAQLESLGRQGDVAFLLVGLQRDFLGLVADGRKFHFQDGLVGRNRIASVNVADDPDLSFINHHIHESQGLAVAFVGDFSAEGKCLRKQGFRQKKEWKEGKNPDAREMLHS